MTTLAAFLDQPELEDMPKKNLRPVISTRRVCTYLGIIYSNRTIIYVNIWPRFGLWSSYSRKLLSFLAYPQLDNQKLFCCLPKKRRRKIIKEISISGNKSNIIDLWAVYYIVETYYFNVFSWIWTSISSCLDLNLVVCFGSIRGWWNIPVGELH